MTWHAPLSRRALLKTAIGGGLALALHGAAFGWVPQWLVAAKLRGLVSHDLGALPIGATYLAERPAEADPARLVANLLGSLPRSTVPPQLMDRRRLETAVRDAIRSDFAAGRTVTVHGWIVSVTEARLAALVIAA